MRGEQATVPTPANWTAPATLTARAAHPPTEPSGLHGCLLGLLEATPGLVLAATPRGRLLYMSAAGRSLLGIDRDRVARLRLEELFTARSYRKIRDEAIPACVANGVWRGEGTLLDVTGHEIPVAQVLTSHSLDEGRTRRTVIAGIAWDIHEHKESEVQLRYRATHDALTGLPNRSLLMDRLNQAIRSAQRNRRRLALLFIDLDAFKQVNDDFGHEAANILLRELGQRLCARVRAADTVARYGGDEFVLLQQDLGRASDVRRGMQLVHEVLLEPFTVAGRRVRIGASVGVALYPSDGEDAETLLRKADSEMYAVKRKKSDRLVHADEKTERPESPGSARAPDGAVADRFPVAVTLTERGSQVRALGPAP